MDSRAISDVGSVGSGSGSVGSDVNVGSVGSGINIDGGISGINGFTASAEG
ncbi:unnamed protein product [[Actinomadura] parvosata subsp. kistnae]|uniref:hypothetical protein n=1 Tax=[Actinomadura] parvosata TaxID=1955412 RepID=UPI000D2C82A7|nr:hypothetical protein [Nonomuraea sp. ATCC 55076]SPL93812.1 unnamed protein product [Actinomadura parvosata subsp. kistnae]